MTAACAALLALALGGCGTRGYTSEGSQGAGKELFVKACGGCHTLADAGTAGTIGPNLDDAFAHQGAAYQYIGFDELTHFSEFQYTYLFSRARSKHGIPCRVRGTCNPEPGWVKKRWAAWVDDEFTGPKQADGDILFYQRIKDVDTLMPPTAKFAKSRTFVQSLLDNNPYLKGTEYEAAGAVPEMVWLYMALLQIPIYALPLFLKPLARRLSTAT